MTMAVLVAALVGFVPARLRRRAAVPQIGPAEYFDAVAAELRRGASLRHAVAWSLPNTRAARLALSGQSMDLVAAHVGRELGLDQRLPIAGLKLASLTGAPSAALFARLAADWRARADLAGELRALSAQARLSAAVVGLLPLLLGGMIGLTRGGAVAASGPARTAIVLGLVLQLAGLAVMVLLVRAHR